MKNKISYLSIFFIILAVACSSCREREPDIFADVKGTYFSLKQYALDEWDAHHGDPVVFARKVVVNGKTIDSSYVGADKLDWNSVLKIFLETDISDRKLLGRYKFSQFDDASDNTHDFMYIAADKDLPTQQLLITMDVSTNKVRGVYVETYKSTLLGSMQQKLYYAPMKTIQIQQFEKPLIGSKKSTRIQYDAK